MMAGFRGVLTDLRAFPLVALLALLCLGGAEGCYAWGPDSVDPCAALKCPTGAQCLVNVDGKNASCVCKDNCPYYGDSSGSRPVCGDNGVDYESICHLEKDACLNKKDISVKFTGHCDPCANVSCPESQMCKLSPRRAPECRCTQQCPLTVQRVCGSDGKTYLNACVMGVEACRSNKDLRVLFAGPCEDGPSPCASLKCEFGEECYIDTYNKSSCACMHVCEPVMRAVCGRDKQTYDSECELRRAACRARMRNAVDHQGPCGSGGCVGVVCPHGGVCGLSGAGAACACPTCADELDPVCGNNGISYPNECKLRQESCQLKIDNFVKYQGYCEGCERKTCDHYAVCMSEVSGIGVCRCPQALHCAFGPESRTSSVCGTDGQTYGSECLLKVAACTRRVFIMVASKGACESCANVECPYGARCEDGECVCPERCPRPQANEEVCGSDGKRYDSQCKMMAIACRKGIRLRVKSTGSCVTDTATFAPKTTIPSIPVGCSSSNCGFAGLCIANTCVCDLHCRSGTAVCGSDGRVYASACHMDLASCSAQVALYAEPMDNCRAPTRRPPPLLRPSRGSGEADCLYSEWGCCRDGRSPAFGPAFWGCGFYRLNGACACNPVGSYRDACGAGGQCPCRPGVSGKKCDHCLPGFWGIHLIPRGELGCQPCGCSPFGSARADCEQGSGRCVCKPGVLGRRCKDCRPGQRLDPSGCADIQAPSETLFTSEYRAPRDCSEKVCHHGAQCRLAGGAPKCECPATCAEPIPGGIGSGEASRELLESEVCGDDGMTYSSLCQLKMFACRHQRDLVVASLGPCPNTIARPRPETRKVTREDGGWEEGREASNEVPPARPPLTTPKPGRGSLGSRCWESGDCRVDNSICADHVGPERLCLCKRGFVPRDGNQGCMEFVGGNGLAAPPTCVCLHGGHCAEGPGGGWTCECPPAWAGPDCGRRRRARQLYILPQFGGHSWMSFEKMRSPDELSIRLEFKPETSEGLLLYNGQRETKRADFISLAMLDGHLELRYNLGDGPITLRSREPLVTRAWQTVSIRRKGRRGRLEVEGQAAVKTSERRLPPGSNSHLNLALPLYLGKVPNMPRFVEEQTGTKRGFTGCVRLLKINAKVYDLRQDISGDIRGRHGVGECGVDPCSSAPCQNDAACTRLSDADSRCDCRDGWEGSFCERSVRDACSAAPCESGGTCVVGLGGAARCICPPGRAGERCQSGLSPVAAASASVAEFHGRSYLELGPLPAEAEKTLTISLAFQATKEDGLLLFAGKSDTRSGYAGGDFVSLSLVAGVPQFAFNLGSGIANISAEKSVTLGRWHQLRAKRTLRKGSLQLDSAAPVLGSAPAPWDKLNVEGFPLFLGGVRDAGVLPPLPQLATPFAGRIQSLVLNGAVFDNLLQSSVLMSGVSRYEGPPCTPNYCRNGGVCVGRLDEPRCTCPGTAFTGPRCEYAVAPQADRYRDRPLAFDGQTQLAYANRVSQRLEGEETNEYSLRFRTNATEGLLLWANKGITLKGDYMAVGLEEGRLSLSFNLGREAAFRRVHSRLFVADARWHRLSVQRRKRQGWLRVDDEEAVGFLSADGATELNTDGHLWIGGRRELPAGVPSSLRRAFRGCLSDVRVGGRDLHLLLHATQPTTGLSPCD